MPGVLRTKATRSAGLSERRCIVRQDAGHQRTLIVGAIYSSEAANHVLDLSGGPCPILAALSHCVEDHPILGAVISDGSSEKPGFAVLETLDLSKHVDVRDFGDCSSEDQHIERLLAEVSDEQFSSVDVIPPWKVVLMALPKEGASIARILVLFAYYHSHGDGRSGLAFHQSFFDGLRDTSALHQTLNKSGLSTCKTSSAELPTPMEQAGKLTLSWSYLLSPLLGAHLPSFLASMLGVRASAVAQNGGIWNGKDLSFDPNNFQTGLAMITIDHGTMHAALQRCRARQASFTGLLNHLIARSISSALGPGHATKAFASQIVIDLRRLCHDVHGDNTMTNCVSAYNETIRAPSTSTDQPDWTNPANEIWTAARNTTSELAKAAGTLHNQPIGLLQYLSDFRGWTLGQIGKKRECSFEISNLVVFDPASPASQSSGSPAARVQIEKTIFSQPANAAGACLNFNLVSTKNGPLVMTVTWQQGVLDVETVEQEGEFVRKICVRLQADIGELALTPQKWWHGKSE